MTRELPPIAILAGGLGTRLGQLTERVPKSLIPVNGTPFIEHQLHLLRTGGFRRVVICVGFLGELIKDRIQNGQQFGLEITYSSDGPNLLGTAGAIRRALHLLGPSFCVVYGDSYLPCDYGEVFTAFCSNGKSGLMTVFKNDGQWDSSNVEFVQGEIKAYDKRQRRPEMRHIDYGLGVFEAGTFSMLEPETSIDLSIVYTQLLACQQLASFDVKERFYEIGSQQGLDELSRYLG